MPLVMAVGRFRRAALGVLFWTKNQEAQILVSGFLSITLGALPSTLEPNVLVY